MKTLILILLLATTVAAQTATIDTGTSYQTWHGLEINAVIGQNAQPVSATNWRQWQAQAITNLVDAGVKRLRIGTRPGMENTTDYYTQVMNGTIDFATYNPTRYVPINDDGSTTTIDPSNWFWSEIEHQMEAVGLPMRRALMARGEKLWINVCFTDFTNNSAFDFESNPNEYGEFVLETYRHFQSKYGFIPDSWELILEPDNASAGWSAVEVSNASAAARSRLLAAGFTPYFVGPSVTFGPDAETFYTAMETQDANGVAAIKALSWHEYGHNDNSGLTQFATFAATKGITTAMNEFIGLTYGDSVDYAGSNDDLGIFQLLKFGKVSTLEQFSGVSTSAPGGCGKLWSADNTTFALTEESCTRYFRQFFKYMRQGAVRKGSSTTNTNWDCLPFLNPGGNWNVPCRALASGTYTVAGMPNGTYHVSYSTDSANWTVLSDVTVSGGSPTFTVTMPAAGVATIWQDPPGPFYVSTAGSGTTCTIGSPCSLATAATCASGTIKPGSVVYLRGGTYQTKLTISCNGTTDAPVVYRSYPGEWAVIDGYVTSTLASSINNVVTSLDLVDASRFVVNQKLTFHDQAQESQEEIMRIDSIVGNTLTVQRGWDGTTAKSHTAGALGILGGSNVTLSGHDIWLWDMEAKNTDPVRTWDNANGQASPHQRGSLLNTGARNRFIGLVVHNNDGGLFSGSGATDEELADCLFINNGYVDINGGAGHNWYIQNDAPSFKSYYDNHSLYPLSLAFQEESVSGNTENVVNSGNIIIAATALIGAGSGNVDNIIFGRQRGYWPSGNGMRFGYAGTNGNLYMKDNYLIEGGGQVTEFSDWSVLTGFQNTFVLTGTGQTSSGPFIKQPGSTTYVWDYNRYYDTTSLQNCTGGNARAILMYGTTTGDCGSTLKFSEWLTNTTFDDNTTSLGSTAPSDHNGFFYTETAAPAKVFIDPSSNEANRVNVTIYNPSGASSVNVDLSAAQTSLIVSRLSNGFQYAIYSSEDPVGIPVATGTYNGSSISIPMNGTTVNTRIGLTTPTTKRPYFGSFIIRSPLPLIPATNVGVSGKVTFRGKVAIP